MTTHPLQDLLPANGTLLQLHGADLTETPVETSQVVCYPQTIHSNKQLHSHLIHFKYTFPGGEVGQRGEYGSPSHISILFLGGEAGQRIRFSL